MLKISALIGGGGSHKRGRGIFNIAPICPLNKREIEENGSWALLGFFLRQPNLAQIVPCILGVV